MIGRLDNFVNDCLYDFLLVRRRNFYRLKKRISKIGGADNLQFLNAILYVAENGSKNGVLDKIFTTLQAEGIININVDVVFLDSTTIKVHLDACGALKKRGNLLVTTIDSLV